MDSSDLFGGYKPLELQQLACKMYVEFVDLFMCTFSRAQNVEFLVFVDSGVVNVYAASIPSTE